MSDLVDGFPVKVRFVDLGETWELQYPELYLDAMIRASELEESGAPAAVRQEEFAKMLAEAPELFGVAGALAQIYEGRRQLGLARVLFERTLDIARGLLPDSFVRGKHRIVWGCLDNRPFLRLLSGYAQFLGRHDGLAAAVPYYEELMSYNPNDNQGIRGILATAYLNLGQPEKVVRLASHYPEDTTPELVMGAVLALYRQGKYAEAGEFLRRHRDYQRHVVRELLDSHHYPPARLDLDYVRVGGADEAYLYWESQGKLWQETPGALQFLAGQLPDVAAEAVVIADDDVLRVDMLGDMRTFLQELEQGPLKLTATGNLSLKGIVDVLPRMRTVQPVLEYLQKNGWKASKEENLKSLHLIRLLSGVMGLTRKKGDKLYLTQKGKVYLAAEPADQCRQLLQAYWYRFNWAYLPQYLTVNASALIGIVQDRQRLVWRELSNYGQSWIDYAEFCHWLRDKLGLEPYLAEPFRTPEQTLLSDVRQALFARNLEVFGCVEVETKDGEYGREDIVRFRLTPLGRFMCSLEAQ